MYYTRIYPDAAPERGKVPPLRQGVSEKSKVSSISTNAAGFCVKKPWAIPHNSKCRYGERGAAAAKPKAQIILDAAKVSAASGGNSEPKQGQRSQSARGFLPPKHDASTATRHYRAFWQRRCCAAAAEAVLKPSGGNCAVLPLESTKDSCGSCLKSCLCLRNVRHFPCFQIRLENQRTMNKEGIL